MWQGVVASITSSSAAPAEVGSAGADRRFDQLGRCPGGELERRCLVGCELGRGQRQVVAGQPVEQDRAHPLGPLDAELLTACPRVTDRGLDQWQGVRPAANAASNSWA